MNTLDMHTREKAHKIHIEGMQREAKEHRLLRKAKQNRNLEAIRLRFSLTFAALVIVFGLFLLMFALRF